MNIRRTLLIAFLGAGMISAILLASLAFVKARNALRAEIERNMLVEARSVSADIDKMMFERLQNAAVWSQLDIMQDLQVRDVDKRLSHFLSNLKMGYRDVYLHLSCTDTRGRILASSDAEMVGEMAQPVASWQKVNLSGQDVELKLDRIDQAVRVFIDVPIASTFTQQQLGQLRLVLDWGQIDGVLDRASGTDGRMIALMDASGRVIAGSSGIRGKGLMLSSALADWRRFTSEVGQPLTTPLFDSDVIVIGAQSLGYGYFAGFGWTTLMVQPVDQAFAPVHSMAVIFVVLLAGIAAFTLLLSSLVSHAIARPIIALTSFARTYMRSKVLHAPPTPRSGELRELTAAFVQMVRDIDLSQQNLIRASKLAVVGEMSAIIAHEVRTPLGILRSSAQMLQRESGISTEGRELVGFINSETQRLNRLMSAMLDTAQPRSPTFVATDLHDLIRRSIRMLSSQANTKNVRIVLGLRAADARLRCDEEQITQVVLNLLMNGLQILQNGGTIDVSTRDDRDNLYMEIADDGPGIDPTERARVFEAFFFKREGGIGLGLAIVQQIVASHRGEVDAADSKLGGAMFRVRIPRNPLAVT